MQPRSPTVAERARRLVGNALLLTCGLLVPAMAAEVAPPHRVALVIGNGAYTNAPSLRNPVNDANDVCDAFRKLGFETRCQLNIKTAASLRAHIQSLASALGPGDVGVFYYAGHAVQVAGENYLIPTEANLRTPTALDAEAVNVKVLMQALDGVHNRLSLVVLDACRSNPWLNNKQALHGLARMEFVPAGTIVVYATGANEEAFDGDGRNGTLTQHFLRNLTVPQLSVEEMIKRVSAGVQNDSLLAFGRKQTPYVYTSFTGEYCFAGCSSRLDVNELSRRRNELIALKGRIEQELRSRSQENLRLEQAQQQASIVPAESSERRQAIAARRKANDAASIKLEEELQTTLRTLNELDGQLREARRHADQENRQLQSSQFVAPPPL
ncbi:caspase family protein [Chitinimonas sp.]|uniref:caspase family protein n=1 Tax=Chitinimonas sp. TaxID=1934313 RepID=UPI0035B141C8